jgi:trk system potassium uptake protein
MRFKAILKVIGIFLTIYSFTMLTPIPVSFYFHDHLVMPFFVGFAVTFIVGLFLWTSCYKVRSELKIRDGFLVVALFWVVISTFAALPLWIGDTHHFSFTNAMFEAVSGFTTTGASGIVDLNILPKSLLYYRQQLQFLGGMGIVVLAVAILPMLGIGGMQLYRAETPGPMKEDKMTPRITEVAKNIWLLYLGLVIACCVAYWLAGMSAFDALEESFSTISTGGFSIHSGNFAYYHSRLIEMIAVVFMFLGGVNFSLHYLAITKTNLKVYWQDVEFRTFFFVVLLSAIVIIGILFFYQHEHNVGGDVVSSLFTVTSFITTTGFVANHFASWPLFVPFLLMVLGLLGACGGSTSGGFKVVRAVVLKQHFFREMNRLIHPQGVYSLKYGNRLLPNSISDAVWAFSTAYLFVIMMSVALVMATGVGFESAFGCVSESISNCGIGMGTYAYSAVGLGAFSKWVMMFDMIAGRLEVFTIILLFSRAFWRR